MYINKNFNEVLAAMSIASVHKVRDCIESVKWEQRAVSDALTDADLNVEALCSEQDKGDLKTVNFYCTVTFEGNEIVGVCSPCFSCLYVEVSFNKRTGKYAYDIGYGPKGMLSTEDYETWYDAEFLCDEFQSGSTDLHMSDFVCNHFDFAKFCKAYGIKKVTKTNTGDVLFDTDA